MRDLYRGWPFFASVIDTAELSLGRSDLAVARGYLQLATTSEAPRLWDRLQSEFEASASLIEQVTGRSLLADAPAVRRSIELRRPYVQALGAIQVDLLHRLRSERSAEERARLVRQVHSSINALAAGLQNTG